MPSLFHNLSICESDLYRNLIVVLCSLPSDLTNSTRMHLAACSRIRAPLPRISQPALPDVRAR